MTIASSSITELYNGISDVSEGLLPLILVFFGTLLAFYIARSIIGILGKLK